MDTKIISGIMKTDDIEYCFFKMILPCVCCTKNIQETVIMLLNETNVTTL